MDESPDLNNDSRGAPHQTLLRLHTSNPKPALRPTEIEPSAETLGPVEIQAFPETLALTETLETTETLALTETLGPTETLVPRETLAPMETLEPAENLAPATTLGAAETLGVERRGRGRGGKGIRSSSIDIDRDQAWERKKQLFMSKCEDVEDDDGGVGSVPECMMMPLPLSRACSVTDEDVEELRGCIDLGFRFGHDEDDEEVRDLSNTLPALELYYAVHRQLKDVQLRLSSSSSSSPISTLERTSSGESFCASPLGDNWRISTPGDNPSEVKTRLRHWAKVVACSVKQLL